MYTLKQYILMVMQGQMNINDIPDEYRYYVIRVCAIQDKYEKEIAKINRRQKRFWFGCKISDWLNKIKNKFKLNDRAVIVHKNK